MKHPCLTIKLPEQNKKKYKTYCEKIISLFATHAYLEIFQEHELELMGIIDMLDGLEYHYKNFIRIEKNQRKHLQKLLGEEIATPRAAKNMIHEVVAYLN